MMRVKLVKEVTLKLYARENAPLRAGVEGWLEQIRRAHWLDPGDIKKQFASADLLGNGSQRVIFNLGGNNCRMICWYRFGRRTVRLYINWIGTHAEYSELCKRGLQYSINDY
ncbi:MAG: type II toxin-antitoxin system HigB family toxin [Chitinophagaceae bacterium]|nr:type II toxin-antitoxin system HigB family toxin [Chitinophagaceae bacterium]